MYIAVRVAISQNTKTVLVLLKIFKVIIIINHFRKNNIYIICRKLFLVLFAYTNKTSKWQVTQYQFLLVLSSLSISLAKNFLTCIIGVVNICRWHPTFISRVPMKWIPTGNRRRGRPKETWERNEGEQLDVGTRPAMDAGKNNIDIPSKGLNVTCFYFHCACFVNLVK